MITDDNMIQQDIVDHLAWDARVDAINIDVRVQDGAVQLVGTIPTYGERMAAYENAWNVPGVVAVDNQLIVTPPDNYQLPADEDIRDNIDQILRLHPSIDSFNIDPVVNGGRVELRGSVDAYWKKQRAESIVADLGGVVDIQNRISVEPQETLPDGTIANAVKAALARNIHVDARKIDVTVEDSLVTLSGSVPTWGAYREAYQTALYTTGVTGILDELSIQAAD